eukprot:RCo031593
MMGAVQHCSLQRINALCKQRSVHMSSSRKGDISYLFQANYQRSFPLSGGLQVSALQDKSAAVSCLTLSKDRDITAVPANSSEGHPGWEQDFHVFGASGVITQKPCGWPWTDHQDDPLSVTKVSSVSSFFHRLPCTSY